jgi:cbb3-type cytochrome oxidase maturation protein
MDIAIAFIIAAVLLASGSWFVFVWAARSGQFRDVEDIKYRMLENEMSHQPGGPDPADHGKEEKDE